MSWLTQIVSNAVEGNAVRVKEAVAAEMAERTAAAVEELRQEVAQKLFGESTEETEEEDDGEDDEELEESLWKETFARVKGGINSELFEEVEELNELSKAKEKQIMKDLDSGLSIDAVIGKHANKSLSNTDAIRKVIKQHAWNKRMRKEEVEELDELDVSEGKWDYPDDIKGKTPKVYWDQGNKLKKAARKAHRKNIKAKAHAELMKPKSKNEEVEELEEKYGDRKTLKTQKGKDGVTVTMEENEMATGKKSYTVTAEVNRRKYSKTFTDKKAAENWFNEALKRSGKEVYMMFTESVEALDEASRQSNLDEKKPVIVSGVKGVRSTSFKKKFRNFDAFQKWLDKPGSDDYEVHTIENE